MKRQMSFLLPELKMSCFSLKCHCSYRLVLYTQLQTKKNSHKKFANKEIFFWNVLWGNWPSSDLSFVYIFYIIEFPEKPFSPMDTLIWNTSAVGEGRRLERQAEVSHHRAISEADCRADVQGEDGGTTVGPWNGCIIDGLSREFGEVKWPLYLNQLATQNFSPLLLGNKAK